MSYTKEEKKEIKGIMAFKIYNSSEYLFYNWLDFLNGQMKEDSELLPLFEEIQDLSFIDQYFIAKRFAEKNYFNFSKFDKKQYENLQFE